MNTATPFPWTEPLAAEIAGTGFRSIFEHAPLPAARCNPQGAIVEMNPAFRQALGLSFAGQSSVRLCDLVPLENRATTESLLRDLFDSTRDSIFIPGAELRKDNRQDDRNDGQKDSKEDDRRDSVLTPPGTNWTAWRLPQSGQEPIHALLIAEPNRNPPPLEEDFLQAQRWGAIGRLTGGVVHDFNNLLTGVMLYCDLLLSSLDLRDCRRRYADEIRSAIMQATGLVRQLLVFARPQPSQARALCLNQIAQGMLDLMTRLIGENIVLESHLDPDLGLVKIDQAQAQQILLNLVLNARDALPDGGHIVLETSNCRFQSVPGLPTRDGAPAFPCVLLTIGDNGRGMDSKTRLHLFEPFFTTKTAGKGTGLGLTTVHSIVATNGGLIHIESEPGRGTRVMILLPRTSQFTAAADFSEIPIPDSEPSRKTFQEIKKELLL